MEELKIGDKVLFNTSLFASVHNVAFPIGNSFYDGETEGRIIGFYEDSPEIAIIKLNLGHMICSVNVFKQFLVKVGTEKPATPQTNKLTWKS